ncbi:hypothetical protein PoB_005709900 [Plakobranchus ocellatus]|uniref:Uncharacterized protein n=1 Tax=Plakobranchus ocellatus TaxID=259542 RepID=A0AAV4CHC5_9GAST|nr:hypothetical protein PoB_005709900 [Plakobranchus ocellatus]
MRQVEAQRVLAMVFHNKRSSRVRALWDELGRRSIEMSRGPLTRCRCVKLGDTETRECYVRPRVENWWLELMPVDQRQMTLVLVTARLRHQAFVTNLRPRLVSPSVRSLLCFESRAKMLLT